MKPGNLQQCKVLNPAVVYREMRVSHALSKRSAMRSVFYIAQT